MDILLFLELYASAHNIPIAYIQNQNVEKVWNYPSFLSPNMTVYASLLASNCFPVIFPDINDGMYSLINVDSHKNTQILIGPAFTIPPSGEIIHAFIRQNAISSQYKHELENYLINLDRITYTRFVNLISFFHFSINGEHLDSKNLINTQDQSSIGEIATRQIQNSYDNRENEQYHGTFLIEQQILDFVKSGDESALSNYLLNTVNKTPLSEGHVGSTPLRQAKNIFIAMVALVGKQAAIPSGMDIEETYQLIDAYSIECESLNSIDDIFNLNYNMLLDFTRRIGSSQLPDGISPEIFECIHFVNIHLNEPINVTDVANHIHKSRSYTLSHFKEELGFNLGEYITHARIQEAKSLLKYTDKSLSEISTYLCFSSQSYFQNVFKKVVHMTPMEYKKGRK